MKLSNETLSVLKNFATINTNILIREGNTLSTISTGKSVFAKAKVAESFPKEIAIYDLNSLLALLTFAEDQDIDFGENSLTISKDGGMFEYFYASPTIIVAAPNKTIQVDEHYTFDLSTADINLITKAAAITAAPTISLSTKKGKVYLSVGDKKNDTANSYRKIIGETDLEFDCFISVDNFKVIPADYKVTVSQKKLFLFQSEAKNLEYFIAMEPDSVV